MNTQTDLADDSDSPMKTDHMTIWPPLAFALWAILYGYILWYNWGWWRVGRRFSMDGFWEAFLQGVFFYVVAAGVSGFILYLLAEFADYMIAAKADQIWAKNGQDTIVSLRNADGVQGSVAGGMFMIVGHVDSKEVYFYYIATGENSYQSRRWYADRYSTIFEDDRTDAFVTQFRTEFKNPAVAWFATPPEEYRMDFHVPKGTISRQFQLK